MEECGGPREEVRPVAVDVECCSDNDDDEWVRHRSVCQYPIVLIYVKLMLLLDSVRWFLMCR